MSGKRVDIAARLVDSPAEAWVRRGNSATEASATKLQLYTARLTIDVTPELRGRIKVHAFRQGATVADMLRSLLEQHYGNSEGNLR